MQTAPADIHRTLYFSATKRIPATRIAAELSAAERRRTRLWLGLGAATLGIGLWVAWRLSGSGELFYRLPGSFIEALNLLTLSAVATVGLLWLLFIYQHLQSRRAQVRSVPSIDNLYALSPAAFEQFSAELFRAHGYTAEVRGRSGDLGVDLEIVNDKGKRAIAQCKRYRSTVGPEIVRELYGTMIHERVSHAFLVTTAEISEGAREWAAGKPLTLIDGRTLVELANSNQLTLN